MWDGVYARSGKTIKAGEWMGIGGAVVMAGGVVAIGSGLGQAFGGGVGALAGNEEGSDDVESGVTTSMFGLGATVLGFTSYFTGPALMAGGSVRQAKATQHRLSAGELKVTEAMPVQRERHAAAVHASHREDRADRRRLIVRER